MSLDPIVVEFLAKGVPDVQRAFTSIAAMADRASAAGVRATTREASSREREAQRGLRAAERAYQTEQRAKERAAQAAARVFQTEARAKEQAAKRAADAAIREQEREHRSFTRLMQERRKERERAERAYAREADRAGKSAGSTIYGGARSGVRAAAGLGFGVVRGVMSVGGGFSFQDSVARDVRLRGQAAQLSEQARIPGQPSTYISGADVLGKVKGTALRNVVSEEDTLAGLSAFAGKAGGDNLGVAMKNLDAMAQLSRATGASMEDLGSAMAEVFNVDKTQSSEQLVAVMRQLTIQGKLGAVEMKDFADRMAKVSATAGNFGGDKARSIAVLTAFAEEAKDKGGASNPAEAMTAVNAFGATFTKNARLDAFKSFGVDVNDSGGKRRTADDILVDSLLAAEKKGGKGGGGDFDKNMGKMFASVQARRATQGFERVFKDAGGGELGAAAVRKEIERLAGAILREEEVREAASRRNQEIDAQIERAMTQLHQVVGTQLTPKLVELVPVLVQAIPILERMLGGAVKFATWLEANPLAGIGAIIAAAVTKDIAAAMIGDAIKATLQGALTGGGGGAPGIPGGGGGVPKGGPLDSVVVVGGALAMGERGREIYDSTVGASDRGEEKGAKVATMSPSQRAHAMMKAMKDIDSSGGGAAVTSERIGTMFALLGGGPVGAGISMGASKVMRDNGIETNDDRAAKYYEATAMLKSLKEFGTTLESTNRQVAKLGDFASKANPNRNVPIPQRSGQ